MKWIVNIEGKKDQRIVIKFDPKYQTLLFIGQFKPHNQEWVDIVEKLNEYNLIDIDQDRIIELMENTVDKLNKRLKAYNKIAEILKNIKNIEVKEE